MSKKGEPMDSDECPQGGDHSWTYPDAYTRKCGKCGATEASH